MPPLLLLFSVVVGLIVAALVAKKQHSPVTDQLLTVLLASLVFGRLVFVLRFSQSYDSLWQMLDFRDRGIDAGAPDHAGRGRGGSAAGAYCVGVCRFVFFII